MFSLAKTIFIILLGSLLTYYGILLSWIHIDSIIHVLLWGGVSLCGIFIILIGISKWMHLSESVESANPEGAPDNTGSSFRKN